MSLQNPLLVLLLLVGPLLALLMVGVGLYYRTHKETRPLLVSMLAVTWWSLTEMISLAAADLGTRFFAHNLMPQSSESFPSRGWYTLRIHELASFPEEA